MKKLSFYYVSPEYVNHLRNFESSIRGISHVPFVDYESHNRKGKFFCGVVLEINGFQYYVPVSSKTNNHQNAFFLYDKNKRIASLRFDFMFPVPDKLITEIKITNEPDNHYRALLQKELQICRIYTSVIRDKALGTYTKRTLGDNSRGSEKSCDFRLLEDACSIYCVEHNLSSEPLEPAVEMLRNTRPRTLDEIIASATTRASEINSQRIATPSLNRTNETLEHE